jgi:hypothetical protein
LPNCRSRNLSPCLYNHLAITLRYAGRAAYRRSDRRDPLRLGDARASGSAKAALAGLRRFLIYAKSPILAPFLRRHVWGAERPHRFGPSRPLAATYRAVGGHNLQAARVAKASHRKPPPLAPQRARLDRLSCRRKVLLTVPAFNESRRRDRTLWHTVQETSARQPRRGLSHLRSASHLEPQP